MKAYNPELPLISIHIPKCAGTSFYDVLKSWYQKNLYRHYFNEKWNLAPRKHSLYSGIFNKQLKSGVCIHGHFNHARNIGVSDYYPEVNQFITVVRDPFDLHLSNYFYLKKLSQNNHVYRAKKQNEVLAKGWTLQDYLENMRNSLIPLFMPSEVNQDNYQTVLDEQFIAIGISEHLQDSVDLLAKKLGFSSQQVPVSNQSKWDEEVPEGAREFFEENNPLAIGIYDYAKERLAKELSAGI